MMIHSSIVTDENFSDNYDIQDLTNKLSNHCSLDDDSSVDISNSSKSNSSESSSSEKIKRNRLKKRPSQADILNISSSTNDFLTRDTHDSGKLDKNRNKRKKN